MPGPISPDTSMPTAPTKEATLPEKAAKRAVAAKGFWQRFRDTRLPYRKTREDSQQSQERKYAQKFTSADENINVSSRMDGVRNVDEVTVDADTVTRAKNIKGLRIGERTFAYGSEGNLQLENTGRLLKEYADMYLELSSMDDRDLTDEQRDTMLDLEKRFVSVNIPKSPNMGEVGEQAIDAAIVEAAKNTAQFIAEQQSGTAAVKEFDRNAAHVVVTNNKDGSLSVSTAYGPAEVSDDGSIMPTDAREFRRMKGLPWTRARSRGAEEPGVRVSTVRIQKEDAALLRGGSREGWNFSYIDPNGARVDGRTFTDTVHPDQVADFFTDTDDHSVKLYRHEGAFMDALTRPSRNELTADEAVLYRKKMTIVSTSPRVEEVDLGRIANAELRYRMAHPDDTSPMIVADIAGHTTDHVEGLKIAGVDRSEQLGQENKGHESRLYGPRGRVYIRPELYTEAAKQLAAGQFRQFVIDSAQLNGQVFPDELARDRGLIDIILLSTDNPIPPAGGHEITPEQLDAALNGQAEVVRALNRGMGWSSENVSDIDAELLAVALDSNRARGVRFDVQAERQFIEGQEQTRGTTTQTKRELVMDNLREKYGADVFTNEATRGMAEALLDKIAPREIADFAGDLIRVQDELNRAQRALRQDGEQMDHAEQARRWETVTRLTQERNTILANVPETTRDALLNNMQTEGAPTMSGENVGRLSTFLARYKAEMGKRPEDRNAEIMAEIIADEREMVRELGLNQAEVDRMKAMVRPEVAERVDLARLITEAASNPDRLGQLLTDQITRPDVQAVFQLYRMVTEQRNVTTEGRDQAAMNLVNTLAQLNAALNGGGFPRAQQATTVQAAPSNGNPVAAAAIEGQMSGVVNQPASDTAPTA